MLYTAGMIQPYGFRPNAPALSYSSRRIRFPAFPAIQTGSQALSTRESLPDLIERTKNGVVRIEAFPNASGSGFVIGTEGYILTNAHVVRSGGQLRVRLEDDHSFLPRLVFHDAVRDIALLKIDSFKKLPTLTFATQARDGEGVFALGYPVGLLNKMTTKTGIVCAQGRLGPATWIQTDAAINPGDSGGPLLNMRGEVIGMNTCRWRGTYTNPVSFQGMNYAISYETLSSQFNQMILDEVISSSSRLDPPSRNALGPTNGLLSCNPNESAFLNSRVDTSNFVVEGSLVTPTNAENNGWRAGVTFGGRFLPWQLLPSLSHAIYIYDSGVWVHSSKSERGTEYGINAGSQSTSIKTGPWAINHLRVLVSGDTGWLFINGDYAAKLDINGRAMPGQIAIFAATDQGTTPTRFFNFRVRPLSMFQ